MDPFQGRMRGERVVGGRTIAGAYVLPSPIGQCKRKYPDTSVCLLIGSSRQISA